MAESLIAVARELYGLHPSEFTAARTSRAREIKPTDAALSAQIATLRKPSPAAWVVNMLARDDDALDALLQLGEQMREAQEQLDRDTLRTLSGERRSVVTALARAGADLAIAFDHPATPAVLSEVEQTLQAATSDEAAAAAVSSGLLVKAVRAVGFEPVRLDDAVAVPDAPRARERSSTVATPSTSPVQLADMRRRREAKREAERLERDADAATAELDALDRRAERLTLRRTSLVAEISDLREQLHTAETALVVVDRDTGTLVDARNQAEAAAERSSSRAAEARADADALDKSD